MGGEMQPRPDAVAFFDDDHNPPEPAELARVEIPGDIPRGRGGRPKIRRLLADGREDPTTLVEYTRASSLGEVLEDHFAIHLREMRMVTWAVAHDPGLRARAQAVETHGPDKELDEHKRDRRSLREIADTALVICRAETGADRGTALHALTEQWDAHGDDGAWTDFLDDDLAEGVRRYAQLIEGFEVVASEQFVVCDELEAAGTFDRVVTPRWPMEIRRKVDGQWQVVATIMPGEWIVLDVKTNADAKYFGCQYAVQQPTYAHGVPYPIDPRTGERSRQSWPHGKAPRRDWAIIMHLPIESPEDSGLWWVDLEAGMELARAAAAARVLRRRAGMFLPAEPPAPPKSNGPLGSAAERMRQLTTAADEALDLMAKGATADEAAAAVAGLRDEPLGGVVHVGPAAAAGSDGVAADDEGYDYCAHSQPSCDACRQGLNACVECDEPTPNDGLCTPCDEAIKAQLHSGRERTIIGLIHATRTADDLTKVWERYGADGWTPACSEAANVHANRLGVPA